MSRYKRQEPQKKWRRKGKSNMQLETDYSSSDDNNGRPDRSGIDYKKKAKKNRIKGRITLFILLLIIILSVMFFAPFFGISKINVSSLIHLNEQDVLMASGIDLKDNIFAVLLDQSNITQRIKELPYAADAKITFSLPSAINIKVEEENTFAYIDLPDEKQVLINTEGRVLEIRTADSATEFLLVKTNLSADVIPGKKIFNENDENLEKYLAIVSEISHNNIVDKITYIDLSNENSLSFGYGQLNVILGDAERLDYKMNSLNAILPKLGSNPRGRLDLSIPGGRSYYDNSEQIQIMEGGATDAD